MTKLIEKDNKFLHPFVTTDVVIFTLHNERMCVLLIKREGEPFKGSWALPGGFLLKKETTHDAAERILKDKAGVENVYIEQLYTFDTLDRDPRGPVFSVAHFALVPEEDINIANGEKEGSHLQTPTLFPVSQLPKLAFDHDKIIKYARKRLESKLEYTNVIYSLLPKQFTLSELKKTYEEILDSELDKRNFIKKFLALDLIRETKKMKGGGRQRPARLYEFKSRKPTALKKFF